MEKRNNLLNVRLLRQVLIAGDDIMHFIVAATLLICAGLILMRTIPNLYASSITIPDDRSRDKAVTTL